VQIEKDDRTLPPGQRVINGIKQFPLFFLLWCLRVGLRLVAYRRDAVSGPQTVEILRDIAATAGEGSTVAAER
jgi:hypothetical protein